MAFIAKKAKTKRLRDMAPADVIENLFVKFILYLRGEEFPVINGRKLEYEVEWKEDGSFKPTEKSIANVFNDINGVWVRYVHGYFKKEAWSKYEEIFKEEVSKEWNASKMKSTSTAVENQS